MFKCFNRTAQFTRYLQTTVSGFSFNQDFRYVLASRYRNIFLTVVEFFSALNGMLASYRAGPVKPVVDLS